MNHHDDSLGVLAEEDIAQLQKHSWIRRHWISLVSVIIIIALSAVIYFTGFISGDLWAYGYLGVFLISILGSVVILVPIPSLPVVFLMGMLLNPWLVALMVGLGEPIGEIPTYLAGRGGRASVEKWEQKRFIGWLTRFIRNRPSLFLFFFALLPNPAFDLAGATSGAMRYPFWKFLISLFLGKTGKGLIIAFAGYWTLHLLLRLFIG